MDESKFIECLLPGNYFITKSMELTKVQNSGTLWYTKKFIVLYYYIFLSSNITTLSVKDKIKSIFNTYINSLPEQLRVKASNFFYSSKEAADLRSDKFRLFDDFAGQIEFANDNDRISYYECAKKYYFAFLMGSGGQSGVNEYISNHLYKPDFSFSNINKIIIEWAEDNRSTTNNCNEWLRKYVKGEKEQAVRGMRNDYMAFIRNERQILFFYGFFHSKSYGSVDREFSSLTPIGELALKSNFHELISIWEHQKLKMLSQPVNITIDNIESSQIGNTDYFTINNNPYLTILRALKEKNGFTKDYYQYIISRLSEYPSDGLVSDSVIDSAKHKVNSFGRKADVNAEDFRKELLKYILGIRSDMPYDNGCNPLGLCRLDRDGLAITSTKKLDRLIEIYSILCDYKNQKYSDIFRRCSNELRRQYTCRATGEQYQIDPKIKIDWDIYNIHSDLFILLAVTVLLFEEKEGSVITMSNIDNFVQIIKNDCPHILDILGLSSKVSLKKELKNIVTAFSDKNYDAYLRDDSNKFEIAISDYFENSQADLERKINQNSILESRYENGVRKRNMTLISLIKTYNIQRYAKNGQSQPCECCGQPTFITFKDEPYIEYHHIIPFSAYDGPDHSLNIIALCPMCHRKLHYIKNEEKQLLYKSVKNNSYNQLSIEERLKKLFNDHMLKSYQLEFLIADNAIDEDAYNRILQIA